MDNLNKKIPRGCIDLEYADDLVIQASSEYNLRKAIEIVEE